MNTRLKFILPLIVFTIAFGYWFMSSLKDKQSGTDKPQVLGEIVKEPSLESPDWFLVPETKKIILIPNYQEKLTSTEAKIKYGCESLVSAGFYSVDNHALGLVVNENQTYADYRPADLFNGVYSINNLETPRITRTTPIDSLRVALQAGPLLIENSFTQQLQLAKDKEARRVVVATTGDNQTLFFVFYNPQSLFMGPLLKDLPNQLADFSKANNLGIADALNLDGGTASVFMNDDLNLTEASTVGSFFCILPR